MEGAPILEVKAQEDGVLLLRFDSGNLLSLDMKPKFSTYRFGVLSDSEVFASADTDGYFVYWYKNGMAVAELGSGEIMEMTRREAY